MPCSNQDPMSRTSKARGFTLIEIMIVVAILGVLAGLAAMNLTRTQQRSRFRSSVRDVMGLITEARSQATQLAGAISDGRVVDNLPAGGDCPIAFSNIRNGVPNPNPATPGVAIDTVTRMVQIVNNTRNAPPLGPPAIPPLSLLPTMEIDCRTEDLDELYRSAFVIDFPQSAATLASVGTTLIIGFDGRGMLTTAIPGAFPLAGRVVFSEPATAIAGQALISELVLLVNGGGQVCVEGGLRTCANYGRF